MAGFLAGFFVGAYMHNGAYQEPNNDNKESLTPLFPRVMIFAFLGLNLWYRFLTIFDYSRFVGGLFVGLAALSLVVVLFPRLLKGFLFLFGFSFFMFGFRAYDIQSQVFDTVVVFVALTVFFVGWRGKKNSEQLAVGSEQGAKNSEQGAGGLNRQLLGLILCYIGLSVLSLILLPLGHIVKDFWFFGVENFFMQIANATSNSHLYPLGGINRLVLFFVLAYGLAVSLNPREQYRWLFVGLFVGTVFCAFLGLLDFYGIVSLNWYRKISTRGVLHSMFLNRGWFAEFVLTLVPFVLLGFMSRIKGIWWKIVLFSSLIMCELALILAGARAGWVSYPLILFICWLFSYFSKEGRFESFHFKWKDLVKVAVSVPITIIISFLIIFQVFMPLSDNLLNREVAKTHSLSSENSSQYIKSQTARIIDPKNRIRAWTQGLIVGREKLIFGMCYESFCWHANILSSIPKTYYSLDEANKDKPVLDTPHNMFLQLFVSGGIVGLCLWMMIVLYAMLILVVDMVKNKRLINIPVVISIISFHIYGIFQSMQYIPMIWSLIFLNLGYAMSIDEKVLPDRVRRAAGWVVKVMVVVVLCGGVVYFMGRGSQDLAEKYGLRAYAQDQDMHNYLGFYSKEEGPSGNFRWSGKEGLMKIHGCGLVEIRFDCHTPGVDQEPVMVDISVDDERVDRLVFEGIGGESWYYWLDGGEGVESRGQLAGGSEQGAEGGGRRTEGEKGWHEVLVEVSRTWNPKKLGVSGDVRDLGVAVSEPRFLEKLPVDGVGFYGWEKMDVGGQRTEDGGQRFRRFRWTGKRASVPIAQSSKLKAQSKGGGKDRGQRTEGREVFLMCGHPGIDKEPVVVKVLGDGEVLRYLEFRDYGWKRVVLGVEELAGKGMITYEVSRTWNPRWMGVSGDWRDLGVAVGGRKRERRKEKRDKEKSEQ